MSIDRKIAKWLKLSTKSKQFEAQTISQEVSITKTSLKTIQENLEEITTQTASGQTLVLQYDMEDSEITQSIQKDHCSKFLLKDKQIIQALSELNKNSEEVGEGYFAKINPVYTAKDIKVEKELYISIDEILRKEFRSGPQVNQTKGERYSLETMRTIQKEQGKGFEDILMKGMILSIENIVRESIGKVYRKYFVLYEKEQENKAIKEQCGFFGEVYQKYLLMSNVFPFLDKILLQSFNEYKERYKVDSSLCELFADFFWDCVFQISKVTVSPYSIFIEYYNSSDIPAKLSITMKKIIDILWWFEYPLKGQGLSHLRLNNANIEKKKYLSQYVIEHKKSSFCSLDYTSSLFAFESNHLAEFKQLPLSLLKEAPQLMDISTPTAISIQKEEGKPKRMETERKEYQSIDELYNYITDDKKKKSKKRRGKKKKRKSLPSTAEPQIEGPNTLESSSDENTRSNSNLNNDSIKMTDPIVDQFKAELCNISNATEVHKIKPLISTEWIHSISLNSS